LIAVEPHSRVEEHLSHRSTVTAVSESRRAAVGQSKVAAVDGTFVTAVDGAITRIYIT
jgi:hypothetical protein